MPRKRPEETAMPQDPKCATVLKHEFCVGCAIGDELWALMRLMDMSWGYAVDEDRLILMWQRSSAHILRARHIKDFTNQTRETIKQAIKELIDEHANRH